MPGRWHSSSSHSVTLCAGALLSAHWLELELPGWLAFAGIVDMVDRAVLAQAADTPVAGKAMNTPEMMAIATGTAPVPGMPVASAGCCP